MTANPEIKICGLQRREDARAAALAGADYLGVVLVPGSPRVLTAEEARRVVAGLAVPVVVVLADEPLDRAAQAAETVGAKIIQLHGRESRDYVSRLKKMGRWKVWKAVRVKEAPDVLRGLAEFKDVVDGLLLDGWHPHQRGGAGVAFDWKAVEGIRASLPAGLRLIAAGGLNPGNVEEAVRRLAPQVLDVSSGVEERPGVKSRDQITAFIRNARRVGRGEGR